jgi:hypothetical protein
MNLKSTFDFFFHKTFRYLEPHRPYSDLTKWLGNRHARSMEVLSLKSIIFWDMMPCSLLSCNLPDCLFLLKLFLRPWRWRWYVAPKRRLQLNRLHGVISQKMILFITTAVKTSNPTILSILPNRTLAQVVNYQVPTMVAWVHSQLSLWWRELHWGRFPHSTLVSPASSHSTNCFTFIDHPIFWHCIVSLVRALLKNKL